MRKSLALILAIAMVFSMFSSLAFAAEVELTAQQKYDALAAKGIFVGMADGSAGLDQAMTRAQFARVAALIKGLDGIGSPDTKVVTVKPFSDIELGQWYTEEVAAAKEDGIVVGNPDGTFNPNGDITVQELAVIVVTLLGLEVVADAEVEGADVWAAKYIKAITDNKIPFPTNYKEAALRSDLASLAFAADMVINPPASAELTVKSAAQTGAKKIAIEFNRAVKADETVAITLKRGLVPFTVVTTWNEAKTIATLTYEFDLLTGDYTVAVSDITETNAVKVEAQKVTSISLTDEYLPLLNDTNIGYKVLNQFGEEMTVAASNLTVSAFNASKGSPLTVFNPTTTPHLDLVTELAAVDNNVIITFTHASTGVNATKTLAVKVAPAPATLALSAVAPLKDKSRISVSESGFELMYTFVDQYGKPFKLAAHTADQDTVADTETIGSVRFLTSNAAIVDPDTFVVADGKLTFNTGATAGTAVLTALVPNTGATAFITVKVEAAAGLKTFSTNSPAALVVEGEKVVIPFAATDSFDNVIALKDFAAGFQGQVTFVSSNDAIINDATNFVFNAKTNALELTPTADGTATVYFYVGGVLQNSIAFDVKELAIPTKVTGVKDVPANYQVGAVKTLSKSNVTVIDQYNRAIALGTYNAVAYTVKVTAKDGTANVITITNPDITSASVNTTLTGAVVGSEDLLFTLQAATVDVAGSAYTANGKTIADADIKSYTLNAVDTIFAGAFADVTAAAGHAKTLTLVGVDASGNAVTVSQSTTAITAITSSNTASVATDYGTLKVYGKAKGESTVAAWKGATKLAEIVVTASDAAIAATTVKFTADTVNVPVVEVGTEVNALLEVKDQYGVVIATPTGTYASADPTKVSVVAATGVVTHVAAGTTTVSFVSSNGISASIEVVALP